MLDYLKKLPIDLGRGNLRFTTKGKLIALSFVKNGYGKTALDVGCRENNNQKSIHAEYIYPISFKIAKRQTPENGSTLIEIKISKVGQ